VKHRVACAEILLEFGAALSPTTWKGETPLMWAERNGLTDVAAFLKGRGAR
jgi:ankyrin repeat protein